MAEKFIPHSGPPDATPGNFYNFGTDYEQDERIGFGGLVRLPENWGLVNAKLSVETFFLDNSALSNSILSHPGLDDPEADRLGRYTGGAFGPSNTGSFDNFTVALRGGVPEHGLAYQVSFTKEATDAPGGLNEYGESIGASYDPSGDGIPLTSRLGVTPFIEYTHFNNFSGVAQLERHYLVGGATFAYGHWNFIPAAGLRKSDGPLSATDHQENFSINYNVTKNLSLGAGVNYTNIAARGSITFGPSLNYAIKF